MYMVLRRFRKKQPINYEILIQVKYLEISVETVAEEYGLTKSGVNNRIYKAKRWLQEEFRKVYEEKKTLPARKGVAEFSYGCCGNIVRLWRILQ